MDRRLLLRLGLGAAGVGGAFWLRDHVLWAPPKATFDTGETTGWLPWAVRGTAVPTVRATIGGRQVNALVDSGAQYSVIDRALYAALGAPRGFDLPLVAYGVSGAPQMGKGAVLDLSVGSLRLTGLRVGILALGPLAGTEGLNTPLVLGQDVLGRLRFGVDADRRRLVFTAPGADRLPPDVSPVPVTRRGRALVAAITVEGVKIDAVVDTGASGLLSLRRSAAAAAGLLDGRAVEPGSSLVLGGAVPARIVRARTMTFADQVYRDRPVSIFADTVAPGVPDALLGMGAFAGRRAVMDLGAGKLWASRPLDLTVA
ncbi:MAG: aspartyl protease family protein [Caulobacterales bacterium]|nr:aspartyl protease family protein [Caulobacterales bacterium]